MSTTTATRAEEAMESGKASRLFSLVSVLAGVWLIVSPWALGFSDEGNVQLTAIITGALVVLVGLACAGRPGATLALGGANVALGLWLLVAYPVFRDGLEKLQDAVAWDFTVTGLVVILAAVFAMATAPKFDLPLPSFLKG